MHLLYATDHRVDAYLVKALREVGHVVEATDQPADGLAMAASGDYQAIVLDWSGPPAACAARYAAAAVRSLVVVIAAAADEAERTEVLRAGAVHRAGGAAGGAGTPGPAAAPDDRSGSGRDGRGRAGHPPR